MCIYLKGPGNTDVFKSDRFLSHRFAVRLNRMQVPCRAKITKILSLFEGIRKLSKWVEVHGKKRIPHPHPIHLPPFRISNNRRGKIEMVKWQGGDFREGMRMMG